MKKTRGPNQSLGVDTWVRFAQGHSDLGWRSDNTFALPTEGALIAFATHLATTKSASPTVARRRLRGVGSWFRERLGRDPRFNDPGQTLPQLDQVLRGISMLRSTRKRKRDPVTASRLKEFTHHLSNLNMSDTDTAMIRAAMWPGMMGLPRAGETTSKTEGGFDPAVNATREDITMHCHQSGAPSHMVMLLRQSKCDQTGRGVEVTLYATNAEHCAVQFMDECLAQTAGRASNSSLFAFQSQRCKPLTRTKLNKAMQVLAAACGFDPKLTTTHSLRQGGAVTLFSLGHSADHIKKSGRWLSGAHETHLSIPEGDKATVARRMVASAESADNEGVQSHRKWKALHPALIGDT